MRSEMVRRGRVQEAGTKSSWAAMGAASRARSGLGESAWSFARWTASPGTEIDWRPKVLISCHHLESFQSFPTYLHLAAWPALGLPRCGQSGNTAMTRSTAVKGVQLER